jgi:hypothetical protein
VASTLVIEDLQTKIKPHPIVTSFFCEFSTRDGQTTLHILQSLLRQSIEQGDAQLIIKAKNKCQEDPSKLRDLDVLCAILQDICSSQTIYLILDAPDELKKPDELLLRLQPINDAGCKVLIMSRELREMNRRFGSVPRVDIGTKLEDLRQYATVRIEDSEFADKLSNLEDLIGEFVSRNSERLVRTKACSR